MMIYVCAISPASIRNDRFLGSPVVTLLLMLRDCRALLSMTLSALHKWYQLIINHLALLPWTNKKAHCGVMFANDIHVCNISKYDFAYSSHDSVLCFVMWLSCDAVFSWEVPKHQNAKTPWGNRFLTPFRLATIIGCDAPVSLSGPAPLDEAETMASNKHMVPTDRLDMLFNIKQRVCVYIYIYIHTNT